MNPPTVQTPTGPQEAEPTYLVDANGNIITTLGGGSSSGSSNTVAATNPGTSATTANPVQGVTGGVPFPVSGTVAVGNFPATQPVSQATQPLPTGAATASNQIAPTVAGTSAASANPVQGVTGGVPMNIVGTVLNSPTNAGPGVDSSSTVVPATLTTLATFTVTNPGAYYVQNQSASQIQVIYSNPASGASSIQLLASGGATNTQGSDTAPAMAWFTGKIIVAGPANSQFMARHN